MRLQDLHFSGGYLEVGFRGIPEGPEVHGSVIEADSVVGKATSNL